jgi:hypothetical protein
MDQRLILSDARTGIALSAIPLADNYMTMRIYMWKRIVVASRTSFFLPPPQTP